MDCVANGALCQKHQITAFPSIRIFIHGTDDVVDSVGRHNHLAYYGDRTTEALTTLAEQAAEAHGKKPHMHGIQHANAINQKGSGCNFSGMLLVKKYGSRDDLYVSRPLARSLTLYPIPFPRYAAGCRARCTFPRARLATTSTTCR